MQKPEEITISSYDQTVDEYIKNTDHRHPEKEGQKFLDYLDDKKRILDLGCGYGRDSKIFSDKGLEVTGADLSTKMIDRARQKFSSIIFQVMDVRDLKFDDESLDGIWANSVYFHISKTDFIKSLKEAYRVLKKDGVFYLSMKLGEGEVLEKDERYNGVEKFWSFYSQSELEKMLTKDNFEILDSYVVDRNDDYTTNPYIKIFCKK